MLSFMDTEKFIKQMLENKNIKATFVTKNLSYYFDESNIITIICEDPRYYFYKLKNHLAKQNYTKMPSKIASTAIIHPKAYVCQYNVEIGENTIIEPNVNILADVCIGDNCIIRAGSVLGSEGFEYKKTSKGILPIFHDGKVILGDRVEIGANTCIDKGFKNYSTKIGNDVKIDNLCYIAHSTTIDENCLICSCCSINGSVHIGKDTWIGPNSTISNQINVEKNAFISIGSVVTKNVFSNQIVSGNFAIEHSKFLNFLKTIR